MTIFDQKMAETMKIVWTQNYPGHFVVSYEEGSIESEGCRTRMG